jgi:hypothetical protein
MFTGGYVMDELVAKKKSEITSLAGKFCEEHLNDEYQSFK